MGSACGKGAKANADVQQRLMEAADYGDLTAVDALLKAGADVDAVDVVCSYMS